VAVIHQVFANRSNAGDWLSARGIRSLLAPHEVREHLCDEPFVADTLAELAASPAGDLVVIGGGGLVMDYFAPLWRGLRELPRLRTCLWGVGVVDHKAAPSLRTMDVVRVVAARALLCRVRDERTRELLAPLRLDVPVPCPSLVAVPLPPGSGHGVLHVASLELVGEAAYARMRSEAMAFAERSGRPFREINNRISAGRDDELEGVLAAYRAADVVLSSRLHGCLLAIATGRKVLAVSGDRKIESAMAAAGLGADVLEPHELEQLPRRLAALHAQRDPADYRARARSENRAVAAAVLAAGGVA
jgi:polysaccharide pyruvyl transferase WcaK-like protein